MLTTIGFIVAGLSLLALAFFAWRKYDGYRFTKLPTDEQGDYIAKAYRRNAERFYSASRFAQRRAERSRRLKWAGVWHELSVVWKSKGDACVEVAAGAERAVKMLRLTRLASQFNNARKLGLL